MWRAVRREDLDRFDRRDPRPCRDALETSYSSYRPDAPLPSTQPVEYEPVAAERRPATLWARSARDAVFKVTAKSPHSIYRAARRPSGIAPRTAGGPTTTCPSVAASLAGHTAARLPSQAEGIRADTSLAKQAFADLRRHLRAWESTSTPTTDASSTRGPSAGGETQAILRQYRREAPRYKRQPRPRPQPPQSLARALDFAATPA